MLYLKRIAERYFDAWTGDGIDAFHADVDEITAWLKREDIRTEEDEEILGELDNEEIEKIAKIITEMVHAELDAEKQ